MRSEIAAIRKDYTQKSLSENDVKDNPILQFEQWWQEVLSSEVVEPNAMTLATASNDGVPSARIVLLKAFSERGFTFFTNYNSFKGRQLAENPKACLVFFWKELERQVRITGFVRKVPDRESEEYFQSRPLASRLSAMVSPQSEVVESREWLESALKELEERTGTTEPERPVHWGGYVVSPVIMEFWQGRPGRLHDRIEYTLKDSGEWNIQRLAP